MKTKHLLFAAALPLAFAACSNEEFDSLNNSPELGSDQRPLVEVKLDFKRGEANTRVDYDGSGYKWQSTDSIGAFLMDKINSTNRPFGSTADAWKGETWLEHYALVDYIHTDYPFSWNSNTNAWEAPSKLQEGNYFFACPYETYEGQRQLIHKIDGQSQTGGTEEDMNAAIAKNQYFIGYAQVKAGTGNKEALKSVVMTPTLAPIKVTLRNIGTLAKDVEKIIVYGEQVATALTVDPTKATYGGTDVDGKIVSGQKYNLGTTAASVGSTTTFNYANVIDATEDVYTVAGNTLVYNVASGAVDYSKADALRQIVHTSYSAATPPDYEKQAVLSFSKPVNVASKGEIHFAVMVNTIPAVATNKLTMDIITTQGQITSIDLTTKKEAESGAGLPPNTVLTNIEIKSLKPGVKNEVIIQFDNNSVVKAQKKDVQDDTELLAFINWNAENVRINTATLLKDVKFTKEMYDALKATSYKGTMAIAGTAGKLLVDNDVPTDVLDVLDATSTATIVLNGERTMTKALADALNGAKMTIENQGTLTIDEEVVAYVVLNNYGTIKVTETGKLKGQSSNDKIFNYGMLENLGEIYNVNNWADPKIKEAKGWIKTSTKANNIASSAPGATVQLTSVSDPLTIGTYNGVQGGTIYLDTKTGVLASQLNDKKVTKLNVTGGTIDLNDVDNNTVKELTINGAVSAEGWNGLSPRGSAYHKFMAVATASIDGAVTFKNAGIEGSSKTTINKGAVLTFAKGDAKFSDITFIKGAAVNVLKDGVVTVTDVTWNGNELNNLGTFQYINIPTGSGKPNVIAGNSPIRKPGAPVEDTFSVIINGTVVDNDNVALNATRTFATLKAMDTYMKAGVEGRILKIKDISITTADMTLSAEAKVADYSDNHYTYLKTYAAGKEVKLGANLSGLTENMGMAFNKLTVSAAATVSSTDKKVTVLTVTELSLDAALTITNGYIQMTGSGQVGVGTSHITGTGAITGKVVTNSNSGSGLLEWDSANSAWKAIQ